MGLTSLSLILEATVRKLSQRYADLSPDQRPVPNYRGVSHSPHCNIELFVTPQNKEEINMEISKKKLRAISGGGNEYIIICNTLYYCWSPSQHLLEFNIDPI